MRKCPRCGSVVRPADRFCPSCSLQLPKGAHETNGMLSGGGSTAAVGSIIMFIQNLMIVLGLLIMIIAVGNALSDPGAAFDQAAAGASLVFFSFLVDYVGLLLIGIGLIALSVGLRKGLRGYKISSGTLSLGVIAGMLCITWVIITVVWRIVYPQMIADSFDSMIENAFSLDPDAIDDFEAMYGSMKGMMYAWIGASVVLVIASFMFTFFLMKVRKEVPYTKKIGSASWPIFTIINAVGTVLLATFILGALQLSLLLGNLLAGLVLKGLIVPFFALWVYYSLTRKFLKLREPAPAFAVPPTPPQPMPPQPVMPSPGYATQPTYQQPYAPAQQPPPPPPPPAPAQQPAPAPGPPAQPTVTGPATPVGITCPRCNAQVQGGYKFCISCGERVRS